jgi:large subunit ribosomal protein L34e
MILQYFIVTFLNKTQFLAFIMVAGRFRSRTYRRVFVRTPGGTTKIQYRKRKPQKAHCAVCGNVLPGVASERKSKMRNMPKTCKRPERPYAGMLCSSCMREKIKASLRK